jgi:hypothetical protein
MVLGGLGRKCLKGKGFVVWERSLAYSNDDLGPTASAASRVGCIYNGG